MKRLVLTLAAAGLAACASLQRTDSPERMFEDSLFVAPATTITRAEIFAVNDDMHAFMATRVEPNVERYGLQNGFFSALNGQLHIDYDATRTQTAAETFAARSGNCLSLVILTSALARQLDVPVSYRSVYGHDTWSRSGGIAFHSGHVNLVVGSYAPGHLARESQAPLVIDFLAPGSAGRFYSREISEDTVVAMFLNNRAGEALAAGDANAAYWLARAAIQTEPEFLNAYNTLGIAYLKHGNPAQAEVPLRRVLEREPDNPNVLENLAIVLRREGKDAEADALRERLAAIAPYPPFYFLDQGLAELRGGHFEAARDLFDKELERMPYDDEVHFAIAVADLGLGQIAGARHHLVAALENSTQRDRRSIYAAKLGYLKQLETKN